MIITNSLTGGGAERSMNLLANELFTRGWQISLVAINSGPDDLVAIKCEHICLERPWQASFVKTLRAFLKLRSFVKLGAPDYVILNCSLPELYGAFLPGKQKVVVVEHAPFPWGNRKVLGLIIRKILILRGAIWVAVSPHLEIWPRRIAPYQVIENPIAIRTKVNSKALHSSRIRRLIYIGRLSDEKQPEVFLNLLENLGIPGLIMGDGYLRAKLESRKKLDSIDVIFLGHVSNPWENVLPGDLLVVPSAWEGDGIVILEGVSHNMPILVSDITAFRNFGLNEINYCNRVEAFESKICTNLENVENLVIPKDISDRILRSRGLDSVTSKWEKLFRNL
jgi:glycosyltransferase involved in cell wall biosynthesis